MDSSTAVMKAMLGILPTGTILAPEQRAIRDLARKRMQLVRTRTNHIIAIENSHEETGANPLLQREWKRFKTGDLRCHGFAYSIDSDRLMGDA